MLKGLALVQRISSGSPFESRIGYSRAVRHGDTVYVSGTTGYDYAKMTMPESVGAQAANALGTIGKALKEAGSDLKDTVRVVYYLADLGDYDALVAAVGPVFADIRPAATMIVCGLTMPEMKIEIEVTARIGAARS
jgi:enamine deaminase RidA (YjgF/YER057c/UK114 family)